MVHAKTLLPDIVIVVLVLLALVSADWFDYSHHRTATHGAAGLVDHAAQADGDFLDLFGLAVFHS